METLAERLNRQLGRPTCTSSNSNNYGYSNYGYTNTIYYNATPAPTSQFNSTYSCVYVNHIPVNFFMTSKK